MTDNKYQEEALKEGQEELTVGGEKVILPEQEPLDAVIIGIAKIQAPNFNNPAVMEWKYSIKFEITSDIPGKGQIYPKWVQPSLNPKSTLSAITKAVGLKLDQGQKFDPLTLKGMTCRVMLANKEKDGLIFQNVDKILPPKS
jgi:hypothetical protein